MDGAELVGTKEHELREAAYRSICGSSLFQDTGQLPHA
jgi:hypothetical protein